MYLVSWVNYMRSLRDSIRRIVNHTDYIVGLQIKIFYIFTFIFSAIISYAYYSSPSISLSLLPIFFFIYAALISGLATEPVDELSKGTIQVYLATGLTREEYFDAWLIGGIILQTIVFPLIYSIPAFIVDPSILIKPVHGSGINVPLWQLLLIGALQIIYYGATGMTIGAITKKRSVAIFSIFLLMIIIPFLTALFASIFAPYSAEGIIKVITLICNQLFYVGITSYQTTGVFGIDPVIESFLVLTVFDTALILLASKLWGEVEI